MTVLALTVLVGASGVVAAPSASAAIVAPTAKIAFGDQSLTLAWGQVPGATGYAVQYSTSSSFSSPVTVDAGSRTWLFVRGLVNEKRYYARVVARAGTQKSVSKTLSAEPDNGYPRELTVTAVPAGANAIRVSWTGQGRAIKVGVLAASDSLITRHAWHTAWYPATLTSVVVTVPPEYRAQLGTGSGNPVFVKVATSNSLTAGSGMPTVRDEAAAYRLSPAGTRAEAGTVVPTGTRLRVAEWNVNSVGSTANFAGYRWAQRRTKVAAAIAKSGAALFGTAELATSDAGVGNGLKQWEDLRELLARPVYGGYRIANNVTADTRKGDSTATVGAHLFYDPDVLTRESGAFVSPKTQMGSAWPSTQVDRYFSWARFRVNATGKQFYAVAVHLPAGSANESVRSKEAAVIDDYMTRTVAYYQSSLGRSGTLPIIVMGDFNSAFADHVNGPETVLRTKGYYDASAAPVHYNARISTANITKQIDNLGVPGYPTKPYVYKYPAPRIDYIMVKNAPGSWVYTNQTLFSGGGFDPAYQGSDHNVQWAEIGIR